MFKTREIYNGAENGVAFRFEHIFVKCEKEDKQFFEAGFGWFKVYERKIFK